MPERHVEYPYGVVDVFTARRFGGNQLAVMMDARGLSTGQMQRDRRPMRAGHERPVGGLVRDVRTRPIRGELQPARHDTDRRWPDGRLSL